MMTLEVFNEHVLKGKTEEALYELIKNFEFEKVFLKIQLEQENIAYFKQPANEIIEAIHNYRLYIRDTYKQIEKIGGVVKRVDVEEAALKFQKNLSNIQQIDYQIGGYFEGDEEFVVRFEEELVHIEKKYTLKDIAPVKIIIDKKAFLKEFSKLYVGEWRELYSASDYGEKILDGTGWGVKVHYSNEMDVTKFAGSNAFPYNFATFNKLIVENFNE